MPIPHSRIHRIIGISVVLSLSAIWLGYASLSTGLSSSDKVSSGSVLSASSWNHLVDGVLELDNRTSSITSSGGYVGINNASPYARLDVGGNIRINDGTQANGRILTSDANGYASWTDPGYQVATITIPSGTVVSYGSNDIANTSDVTLTPGIWHIDLSYYMHVAALSGCFDLAERVMIASWTANILSSTNAVTSENFYSAGRHNTLNGAALVQVSWGNAQIHAQRYGAWCSWATYTIGSWGGMLSLIATKVR